MAILSNLVYDRTQADVEALKAIMNKANAEGLDALTVEELADLKDSYNKGAYNYRDILRVKAAVEQLATDLTAAGYPVTLPGTIPVVTVASILYDTDAELYLDCVEAVKNVLTLFDDTPSLPTSLNALNWEKANDIEKILYDVSVALQNMIDAYYYAGELYAGEV